MKNEEKTHKSILFEKAARKSLKRGKVLYCTSDHAKTMKLYFLWDGAVRSYRFTHDGREMTSGFYIASSEWVMICASGEHNHLEALRSSELVSVSCDTAARAFSGHPNQLRDILEQICERFEHALSTQEELAYRSVPERLARLLLSLADQFGASKGSKVCICLELSQESLANMIFASRPTTNIALNRFVGDGIISLQKKKVIILKPEKLREMVEQDVASVS